MIKTIFANSKILRDEKVTIMWNEEILKGMTRSERIKFKEKNKALVIEQYRINKRQEKLNYRLKEARKNFLSNSNNKFDYSKAIKVVAGGVIIATICATSQISALDSVKVNEAVIENSLTATTLYTNNSINETELENSTTTISDNISEYSEELEEIYEVVENTTQFDDSVNNYTDNNIIKEDSNIIADSIITESVVIEAIKEEILIEDDFIIFDKALEMLMERTEENNNGTVFNGSGNSVFAPVTGTWILDNPEDSSSEKVSEWFKAFLGTESEYHQLKYDTNFKINTGGAKFASTDEGFIVEIDTNAIELFVNLDLQHSVDASIRGGVSKQLREYLVSEECQQFMPFLHKLLSAQHANIKQNIIEDQSYLNNVKYSVESELKALTGWDCKVVFK